METTSLTEESIREEMTQFRNTIIAENLHISAERGDYGWRGRYFNEFIFHLTDNPYKEFLLSPSNRHRAMSEVISSSPSSPESEPSNPQDGYSEKFLKDTPEEFYANISRVVKEVGLTEKELAELVETNPLEEFYADPKIEGIYLKLRLLGYQRYKDLV